ncbi:MAG: hypothetical protein DRJ05_12045 [Bacteroidetes bacterium]|nr:MAG: hypothetical protein DRJ05_12045 [Bacteroidota bacterium]
MKKAKIWLSYDLGVDGDYNGMYYFLDEHEAKECGDSIGIFSFEYENDVINELKTEIKEEIQLRKSDRVYVIVYKGKEIAKAGFIFGKRKITPWHGYAQTVEDVLDINEIL